MTRSDHQVTHHRLTANGLDQHFVMAGSGPPVLLLHGFPEFWYAWRHQIPALARHHTVIAPDLRGYGYTGKPYSGYDKRTMATDVRELCRALGHERVAVVGHCRGALVGLRLARDHPGFVERLAVLDNVSTRALFEQVDGPLAKGRWWFLFNADPDLSEPRADVREERSMRRFYRDWAHDPAVMSLADIAEYVRVFRQPGALRGARNDHRAHRHDVAADVADGDVKLDCPVLAMWGADFPWRSAALDPAARWAGVAHDVRTAPVPGCWHLPHEERPEEVTAHLLAFLGETTSERGLRAGAGSA